MRGSAAAVAPVGRGEIEEFVRVDAQESRTRFVADDDVVNLLHHGLEGCADYLALALIEERNDIPGNFGHEQLQQRGAKSSRPRPDNPTTPKLMAVAAAAVTFHESSSTFSNS